MRCRGVAHHDVAEGLLLELGEHVQTRRPGEVVEAVVVLLTQHLRAEHIGKAGAEHAAEGLQLLRQAAEPEVQMFQPPQGAAGVNARGVEEVLGVGVAGCRAIHQALGRRSALRTGGGGKDGGVGAVGGDEVDERLDVLDIQPEVVPAGVRLQCRVARVGIEMTTGAVEARGSGVAAAGQVQGRQVENEAQQIVA